MIILYANRVAGAHNCLLYDTTQCNLGGWTDQQCNTKGSWKDGVRAASRTCASHDLADDRNRCSHSPLNLCLQASGVLRCKGEMRRGLRRGVEVVEAARSVTGRERRGGRPSVNVVGGVVHVGFRRGCRNIGRGLRLVVPSQYTCDGERAQGRFCSLARLLLGALWLPLHGCRRG